MAQSQVNLTRTILLLPTFNRLKNSTIVTGYNYDNTDVVVKIVNNKNLAVVLGANDFIRFLDNLVYFTQNEDFIAQGFNISDTITFRKTKRESDFVVILKDLRLPAHFKQVFESADVSLLIAMKSSLEGRLTSLILHKASVAEYKRWYLDQCEQRKIDSLVYEDYRMSQEIGFTLDFYRLFLEINTVAINDKKPHVMHT